MQRLLEYRKSALYLTPDDTILPTSHKSIRVPTDLGEMYEVYHLESTKCLGFHWRSTHSCPSWKVLEAHQNYYNGQDHDVKHVDLFGTVQWPWGSRCAIVCGPSYFSYKTHSIFREKLPLLIN
jgi:hypothetical protein